MVGIPDEALLAGFVSGDRDATRAFLQRFRSRVYGLALAMLHDPALAEDIAQEAFVRAWQHGPVTADSDAARLVGLLADDDRLRVVAALALGAATGADVAVATGLGARAVPDTAMQSAAAVAAHRVRLR